MFDTREWRVESGEWSGKWNLIPFLPLIPLDKFYKNRNGIKSNSDKKQTLGRILIHYTMWYFDSPSKEIM